MLLWVDSPRLLVTWLRELWTECGAAQLFAESAKGNVWPRSLQQSRRHLLLSHTPPAHGTHRHPSHSYRTPPSAPLHQ